MAKEIELRPSVKVFAEAMERTLRKHDEELGENGWIGDDIEWLINRLHEEVSELDQEIRRDTLHAKHIQKEATDVANFAMMIFHITCFSGSNHE